MLSMFELVRRFETAANELDAQSIAVEIVDRIRLENAWHPRYKIETEPMNFEEFTGKAHVPRDDFETVEMDCLMAYGWDLNLS